MFSLRAQDGKVTKVQRDFLTLYARILEVGLWATGSIFDGGNSVILGHCVRQGGVEPPANLH